MITNAQIKTIASLKQKKYRNELNMFVIEGRKMTEELLKSNFQIINICAAKQWIDDNQELIDRSNIDKNIILEATDKDIARMSNLSTPDIVLAVVKQPSNNNRLPLFTKKSENNSLTDKPAKLVLALDGINNPGNLGTIIRIAAWFGIKDIVCSENTVDCYNPKVLQSTMGAIFHTNVVYTDLQAYLEQNIHTNIYGTVLLNGKNIYDQPLKKEGIIIIGSESHGISKEILPYINNPLTIPSFSENKNVESLNASVACGIVLSEFMHRQ